MNWTIYGLECLTAIILFTCAIMVPLCRDPVWWIHDYPKDIQEKYFETHERIPTQALGASVLMKKCAALLLALRKCLQEYPTVSFRIYPSSTDG